jgi:hypothetical protein
MANGGGYPQLATKQIKSRAEYDKEGSPCKEELKRLRWASQGSTIQVVSNCEGISDWDVGSATNFNCIAQATGRENNGSISLVNTTTTAGDTLTLNDSHRPQGEDWSDFNWICMWVQDVTTVRTAAYNYTFQIRNNGEWSVEIALPIVGTHTVWELKCINIEAYARGNVDGFRFVHRRGANAGVAVYIDNIIVTDLITGVGSAATMCTGPVIGSVRVMPVNSGQTVYPGDPLNWLTSGVSLAAADDIAVVGVMCQNTAITSEVATDTVLREVLVACEGAIVLCRNDGTGCAIGKAGHIGTASIILTVGAGGAASGSELDCFRCLEASTGNTFKSGDTYYQVIAATTED